MRKAKRDFENNIPQKSIKNPKLFWSHGHIKLSTKSSVASLLEYIKNKSTIRFSDKENTDISQHQFSSVFVTEPNNEIPEFEKRTNRKITSIQITHDMVHKGTLKPGVNKSCGPDEVHPRPLKELVDYVSLQQRKTTS